MPCNSDYMNATPHEIHTSRVFQMLDILSGARKNIDLCAWDGYDKRAYGKHLPDSVRDQMTAELCAKFQKLTPLRLRDLPLELQIYWRDHKQADADRTKKDRRAMADKKRREEALEKLTPRERKVLGL